MLARTRTVMFYELDEEEQGFTVFQTRPDEEWEGIETCIVRRDLWLEMGEPMTVTVSVEPGDLLNDQPE